MKPSKCRLQKTQMITSYLGSGLNGLAMIAYVICTPYEIWSKKGNMSSKKQQFNDL